MEMRRRKIYNIRCFCLMLLRMVRLAAAALTAGRKESWNESEREGRITDWLDGDNRTPPLLLLSLCSFVAVCSIVFSGWNACTNNDRISSLCAFVCVPLLSFYLVIHIIILPSNRTRLEMKCCTHGFSSPSSSFFYFNSDRIRRFVDEPTTRTLEFRLI